MADKSGISWTDATWNPCVGCSIKSPGCRLCYAMREAHRLAANPLILDKYQGLTEVAANGRPVWNGVVRLHAPALYKPVEWTRPRLIFVNSMSDLFHETLPWPDIDKVMAVMARAHWHVFQVLTKRATEMRAYMNHHETPARVTAKIIAQETERGKKVPACFTVAWPPPNVHLGVSVERQIEADERVPHLMRTMAAVRWISGEPLLGNIDFTRIGTREGVTINALTGNAVESRTGKIVMPLTGMAGLAASQQSAWGRIDGIVTGGENDDHLGSAVAVPSHPDWHQRIADQCETYGVGFHFKQWGSWLPLKASDPPPRRAGASVRAIMLDDKWTAYHVGKKAAGSILNGKVHQDWPKLPEVEE